jgi:alpha-D-xyloside xylohydrolase
LRGGLSIAMCGHAFWSHDIGGFKGQPTPDLYVRWAQFGAFTPLARAHGTTTRLPWDYGEQACAIFRETMRLRYRLLPYLYSYAIASARDGLPILRPMALEYPDDPNTYTLDLQYFFGSEILVAPVYNQGGRRPVYFPAGVWIDYWSHEQIVGPQTRFIEAPLDRLPLYVRANALIPTVEPVEHLAHGPFEKVTFDAYLLDRGSFELNDDDGLTRLTAFRRGGQLDIQFSGVKQKLALRLIHLTGPQEIESVSVNGEGLEKTADAWSRLDDGALFIELAV